MLHEILLSLSGHPSPLFDNTKTGAVTIDDFPLLTPPEAALLSSIGGLSRRHRELRAHASQIASSHPSTICRAVASSILLTHLARFQRKILEVEENILKRDASTVSAYDIVPLAGVVGEFEEWKRRMDWYWEIACTMQPSSSKSKGVQSRKPCCGADIINKLRSETQTGYPDVEQVALELSKIAESAWLRQLSSWILYGRLPTFGADDFFVQRLHDQHASDHEFIPDSKLLPRFVSTDTAASILFIGKSLDQIRSRGLASNDQASETAVASELDLLPAHLKHLSELTFPMTGAGLSSAISSIRLSLSRNTLQRLLPLSRIVEILRVLQEFFLLGRGEFATTLVFEADERLSSRGRNGVSSDSIKSLAIKEPELATILNRTFATLSALSNDDEDDGSSDATLELARSLIGLRIAKSPNNSTPSFHNILLPVPATLTLQIPSPLDLFLSPSDLSIYSKIHSYLLSIRRAHLHLTSAWRLTSMRRDHPALAGPPLSASKHGAEMLRLRRERRTKREMAMRKVWATCSKGVYFLCELVSYFEGVVIKDAWEHLYASITKGPRKRPSSSSSMGATSRPGTGIQSLNSSTRSARGFEKSLQNSPLPFYGTKLSPNTIEQEAPHDPTALAALHSAFLSSLTSALLLNSVAFTKELRQLLISIGNLVAQIQRLQSVYSNLDLEEDEGVVDALNDWRKEEVDVSLELDRARKKVDEGCRACLDVLGQLDAGGSRELLLSERTDSVEQAIDELRKRKSGWNWRPPGVDRLLMKLEFGRDQDDDRDGDESS